MGNSLLDQLKKSGLVDEKRAKQAQKAKRKEAKKQRQSNHADEERQRLQQRHAEKIKRDKELNLQRKLEADQRAIQAQIKQLVELNQITDYEGDIAHNFTDNNIIKTLYLSEQIHGRLSRGQLTIIKLEGEYRLVPTAVAEKIAQRNESAVIRNKSATETENEDDFYANYKVPDDLMW